MRIIFLILSLTYLILCLTPRVATAQAPNILWITCEDISPAWGCYGDEQANTPAIDALAADGIVFNQAFSNAPICSPARSTLISGMYATSLGTQNLRSEIPVPGDLKILPELLREQGYFTSNNAKTDYNFSAEGRWDENGRNAHWRNRNDDRPFFSVFNFGITHEGHANRYQPDDVAHLEQLHDPTKVALPPYFPDTEEFRKIMAHQYDLITVFDQEVQKLLTQLEEDGLDENTIVFVFSDHGFGLPRYKRWLYDTGLRVPFVLHIPEKYQEKYDGLHAPSHEGPVAFVDFAPTVLEFADAEVPERMQGLSFANGSNKELVFGYRDRADDVYDMSRSVFDGRYLYIRHFFPHQSYIQEAVIFNKNKRSFDELQQVRDGEGLSELAEKMYEPKGVEELYDLKSDPQETSNLIGLAGQRKRIDRLRTSLQGHLMASRDAGLLSESDMMVRAGDQSVYEAMQSLDSARYQEILDAAFLVGQSSVTQSVELLEHADAAVRFWALTNLAAASEEIGSALPHLLDATRDLSIANQCIAAEILINRFGHPAGLDCLKRHLMLTERAQLLQAAISVRNLGAAATPLLATIKEEVYPRIAGEVWGRYKSWMYPMFIGMALDQVFVNCGQELPD